MNTGYHVEIPPVEKRPPLDVYGDYRQLMDVPRFAMGKMVVDDKPAFHRWLYAEGAGSFVLLAVPLLLALAFFVAGWRMTKK